MCKKVFCSKINNTTMTNRDGNSFARQTLPANKRMGDNRCRSSPVLPLKFASLISLLLFLLSTLVQCHPSGPGTATELPSEVGLIPDEKQELSDEELGSIIKDFGRHISSSMRSEMEKLINEVEVRKGKVKRQEGDSNDNDNLVSGQSLDPIELERFKGQQEALARDTQVRIERAGENNGADAPQSWQNFKQNFMSRVSTQLQSAGSFMDHQLNVLSSMGPKVKGKLKTLSGKLLKLMQWPTFLIFKMKFRKVYKSPREELYRQVVFLNNQAQCGVQNLKFILGRASHLLKATEFADTTSQEYAATYDNKEAESASQPVSGSLELSESLKTNLAKLASQGLNIFGHSVSEAMEEGNKQHGGDKQARRRKRSAIDEHMSDPYNELDEDEEDSPMDIDFDNSNEDEDFMVVDEYADEFFENADLDQIDEIESIMDQALEPASSDETFKPIDLRKTNCIIRPENQDKCGCCYAHVTVAAASYYNCMQQQQTNGKGEITPQRYNARFTSDCGRYFNPDDLEKPPINGCRGGRVSQAINFTKQAGTYLFMDYEFARLSYDFRSDKCAFPAPETFKEWAPIQVPVYQQTLYVNLKFHEIDLHLRTVGPVFINLRVWKDFMLQGEGIYGKFENPEEQTIHSMLIVGHDRDARGRDYWILWNSHGTAWGENGFVRIYTSSLKHFKSYIGGLMTAAMIEQNQLLV